MGSPNKRVPKISTETVGNIYRILHGKCVRTVFTHELWRIRNQTSERVRFLIQNNECVNTVQSTFHVVLCLLYTYWDWTPSLNYDKLYSNKCGQTAITERKQLRKKRKSSNKIQNLLQDFRRTLLPKNRGQRNAFQSWLSPRQELSILTMKEMGIKTICSLQTHKAMACSRNRANRPWMKSSTCRTAPTWKNMIRGSWLDVSLFSHVGKAIRNIWLVYISLRTKIYSAAFQCVNPSMYRIKRI